MIFILSFHSCPESNGHTQMVWMLISKEPRACVCVRAYARTIAWSRTSFYCFSIGLICDRSQYWRAENTHAHNNRERNQRGKRVEKKSIQQPKQFKMNNSVRTLNKEAFSVQYSITFLFERWFFDWIWYFSMKNASAKCF